VANPQKENGYTPIANEILEQLIRLPLNGTQFKIILLLWRETYGFSRKECKFADAYIASRLGIKRQNAHTEYRALENAGIIITTVQATFTSPRMVAFAKDYETWKHIGCNATALQACHSITDKQEHSMAGMLEHDTGAMQKHSHRKQPLKQPLKQDDIDCFFESLWKLYPRKEGKGSVSKAQKKKLYEIGAEEMTRAVNRYSAKLTAEKTDRKFIKQGSTFFNSGYVDYLDANFADHSTAEPRSEPEKRTETVNICDLVEYPKGSGRYMPRQEVQNA